MTSHAATTGTRSAACSDEEPVETRAELGLGGLLDGRYRIDSVIDRGGMGVVFSAVEVAEGRPVAIKVLRRELARDSGLVLRFIREARMIMALPGEHTVRVLDVGVLSDDTPYMVMEHLAGHDLRRVLERVGRLPVPTAIAYVLQASESIASAHDAGIIHRDIKPANLFLSQRPATPPIVKVLDFGLAKPSFGDGLALTQTAAIFGSPQYMSPEQLRDPRTVDVHADIWALGATLYELIAGVPPFDAPTVPELCAMIIRDAPMSLHERCPEVSVGLSAIVMRCLEKDPDRRHASISDLAVALEPHASADPCDLGQPVGPSSQPARPSIVHQTAKSISAWLKVLDAPETLTPCPLGPPEI